MTLVPLRRVGPALLAAGFLAFASLAPAEAADPAEDVKVKVVGSHPLTNSLGNNLTAVEVDFAPGASSPSHRHAGFVFAYVLSGTLRSQLNDEAAKTYKAGESWVEPPGTRHTAIENPSESEHARLLAVFVAPKDAELTTYGK